MFPTLIFFILSLVSACSLWVQDSSGINPSAQTTSIGLVARKSFQFNAAFTFTPICTANGNLVNVAPYSDNWYQLTGLTPNTTYVMNCTTPLEKASFTVRTLANEEIIAPSGPLADCFGPMRTLAYNQSTGKLMAWGEAGSTCYAEYNGVTWNITMMTTPTNTASADLTMGTGLTSLPNGTIYAADMMNDGSHPQFGRLYQCTGNCTLASSWSVLNFSSGFSSGAGTNLSSSPDGTVLIYSFGNTPGGASFCYTNTNCLLQTNWSIPVNFGITGSGGQSYSYVDSKGNLWVVVNDATNPLWYCPAASLKAGSCSSFASWTSGTVVAIGSTVQNYSVGVPALVDQLGVFQIMASQGGYFVAGGCDVATTDCGQVTSGVFNHFVSSVVAVPTGSATQGIFHVTSSGWAVHFATSTATNWQQCNGLITACSAFATSAWSTPSVLVDGLSHFDQTVFERTPFSDAGGEPAAFLYGAGSPAGLYYFQ
jgi:hypothetical protein